MNEFETLAKETIFATGYPKDILIKDTSSGEYLYSEARHAHHGYLLNENALSEAERECRECVYMLVSAREALQRGESPEVVAVKINGFLRGIGLSEAQV